MNFSLAELLAHTQGRLLAACTDEDLRLQSLSLRTVSLHSGQMQEDGLFICLVGERTDGHLHASHAIENGAKAILAERDPFAGKETSLNIPVILVENSAKALEKLAKAHRQSMQGSVIALSGTAGKTTVKEGLAYVLSQFGKTSKSYKNNNNQLGLSLSMLNAQSDDDFWVMELGISQAHDMDELGSILQPDIALLLNAGKGHTEGLGEKGVAYHKASLLAHLQKNGQAFVSADYPELLTEANCFVSQSKAKIEVHTFSINDDNVPFYAKFLQSEKGQNLFALKLSETSIEAFAPYPSAFGAENLIAIASVAHACGMNTDKMKEALADIPLAHQRFQVQELGQWLCIDDSYNANPLSSARSIKAALEIALAKKAPLICVMGEMKELGKDSFVEHKTLGEALAIATQIFWIGQEFEALCKGLKKQAFSGEITHCHSVEDFILALKQNSFNKGVILFKGSRSNKLEIYVQAFVDFQNSNTVHDK